MFERCGILGIRQHVFGGRGPADDVQKSAPKQRLVIGRTYPVWYLDRRFVAPQPADLHRGPVWVRHDGCVLQIVGDGEFRQPKKAQKYESSMHVGLVAT
jgi:hypothetical protein